jgi:hypothetical protein
MKTNNMKIQKDVENYFRVALFGSSKIKKNDPIFKEIKKLAKALAEEKIDIVTGGGKGLMQAANEGHLQGRTQEVRNIRSIGIGVKLPWNQGFNDGVEYKKEFGTFSGRLDEFMLLSNAVIVAPGGIGTLLELFYTWQLVQVHHICNIPIILYGEQWTGLLKWIKENPLKTKYLTERDYELVFHVKNETEVIEMIRDLHKHWEKGGKNFCLNYKKYKVYLKK